MGEPGDRRSWNWLLDREARHLYGIAAFGHDTDGKPHRWAKFGDVNGTERDFWLGRAEIVLRDAGVTPANAAERQAAMRAADEKRKEARNVA